MKLNYELNQEVIYKNKRFRIYRIDMQLIEHGTSITCSLTKKIEGSDPIIVEDVPIRELQPSFNKNIPRWMDDQVLKGHSKDTMQRDRENGFEIARGSSCMPILSENRQTWISIQEGIDIFIAQHKRNLFKCIERIDELVTVAKVTNDSIMYKNLTQLNYQLAEAFDMYCNDKNTHKVEVWWK